MVFVMKYRKNLISESVFNLIKSILTEITKRYYLYFDAVGTDGDHLHILVEAAPRYSPSRIMQICKSITAIQVFKKFPKLKEDELWGGEFWNDGGHIDTVGDGYDVKAMEEYIKKQGLSKNQLTIHSFASP